MQITVNEKELTLAEETTVELLLGTTEAADCSRTQRTGIAVAVNGSVIPQSEWSSRYISDGDSVLIVSAAQGG
jgi:sulfur carrier protein